MKEGWKEFSLVEIATIKSGKRLPKGHELSNIPSPYPYIKARDIKQGKVNSKGLEFLDKQTRKKIAKYIVLENDILITIVANIGDVGIVPQNLNNANLTENAVRLTNLKQFVDARYLTYMLSQRDHKEYMESLAAGAAQAKLGIYKIEKIKVSLPSIGIQKRIASILSAYDDLIEVNNQRIELLEQSARELYKEWFVRMRFPNYQNTKFNKGIPEGWEVKSPFEVADILYGFPFNSKLFNEEGKGFPIIRIRDIQQNLKNTFTTEDANVRYFIEDGDILIGMDGDFYVQRWMNGKAYVNQRVLRLRCIPDSVYCSSFIENVIREPIFFLNSIIVGTTVAHLSDRDMKKIQLFIPNEDLLLKYKEIAEPITNKIISLFKQNQELTQIRNRLLPRLISGKLEVKA